MGRKDRYCDQLIIRIVRPGPVYLQGLGREVSAMPIQAGRAPRRRFRGASRGVTCMLGGVSLDRAGKKGPVDR